ncbi:MAG: hypothetical protein COX57_03235 [Alphaproteobacteria bacterium CG_4_10_14_0_2_um_filter_63_37]|nr:MAG: hypothetical protein COX57_03235 [Alphaproteobacteria bacterium CG_4_10_14_0_2_um_filter_63_37]
MLGGRADDGGRWAALRSLGALVVRTTTVGDRALLVVAACLVVVAVSWVVSMPVGAAVEVSVGGKVVQTLSLAAPRALDIPGPLGDSEIEVASGRARFVDGPCQHKLCVRQGWVNRVGSLAVCIPNQVMLRVLGDPDDPDAIDVLVR